MKAIRILVVFVLCFLVSAVQAHSVPDYIKELPSQFTPNGDGLLDVWEVNLVSAQKVDVKIYSRWGDLVFSGENGSRWDGMDQKGKICIQGVYVFVIKVTIDGVTNAYKGTVEVIW